MTEQLISFETAKLAKETGFPQTPFKEDVLINNVDTNFLMYYPDGHIRGFWFNPYDYVKETARASTQSLLQKWLRETHNIHIGIDYDVNGWSYFYLTNLKSPSEDVNWSKDYNTYEEALEAGLQKALKNV